MFVARVDELIARSTARDRFVRIEGVVAALPRVGESIVVFRKDRMTRLITSTVIRILWDERTLYAQTRNSVYRILVD